MIRPTPMASQRDAALDASAIGYAEAAGLRVALSPYFFRSMMVGMAAIAVTLDRVTGNRELTWRFAKARERIIAGRLERAARDHKARTDVLPTLLGVEGVVVLLVVVVVVEAFWSGLVCAQGLGIRQKTTRPRWKTSRRLSTTPLANSSM